MRAPLLLLLAVVACSDASGPPSSVLTALIEGKPFTAVNPPDEYVATYDSAIGEMNVSGTNTSSSVFEILGLEIPHFHGTGRYVTCGFITADSGIVLTSDSASAFYLRVDDSDTLPPNGYDTEGGCGMGEIDVQAYDRAAGTISGVFDVVLVGSILGDTLHVTDGQFHGRITTFRLPPPDGPDTIPTSRAEHR